MMKRRFEPVEQRAVTGDMARIDERHEELGVVDFEALELVDLADLMADDDAEIPERVEDRAQRRLFVRAQAAAEQHQQIDVRVKRELTPSVAADRDDGERLRRARRCGYDLANDGVETIGEAGERGAAAVAAQDVLAKLAAGLLELNRETRPWRGRRRSRA